MESRSGKELSEELCREGFRLAWIERDLPAALVQFRAALDIWPGNPQAHCQIGEIHFFGPKRNLHEALKEFNETVRLAPDWADGHLWLGHALHEMQRNEEAESAYKRAVRLTPNDPRTHISLGGCLLEMKKYSEAAEAFQQGISLKPAYGEISARMMLAEAFRKSKQLHKAVEQWQTVARMEAVWDYEQGEPERARTSCRNTTQSRALCRALRRSILLSIFPRAPALG